MGGRASPVVWALLVGVIVAPVGGARPAPAGEPQLLVYRKALPDVALRDTVTGRAVRLPELLAGRPAVIFLTDGSADTACPLARQLAAHQHEYAPWFSWAGVMSGPCSPERMERLHRSSPVRFQNCLHDPDGSVARALGITGLPALVLANERGYVRAVCSAAEAAADPLSLDGVLHALAAAARTTRDAVADFRLPRVGGGLASYLDVAGSDHTIISFLHTGCLPCARQLEVLEYLRDRHAGGTRLVTVFLDAAGDERIRGFLRAAGASPDTVLRDPRQRLAQRYHIDAVPAVLVADARGRIVYAARGFRDEERRDIYRAIDAAFGMAPPARAAACPAIADPRRIHEEALAYLEEGRPEFALMYLERLRELVPACHSVHLLVARAALAAGRQDLALRSYVRYLAADPLAYDRGDIRTHLTELLAGAP